ncbi:flagellar hook-associated protein FlgL [Pseudoxanthomonas spadix]|uniref:flagellar hook-associated protein FlgL n=1 Tax=Pseudoxanthomonas spadix TaxID=415229 RepID=UPI000F0090CC|nr:flagellar hook-associated protein FlgL [Pseudoxanthomonas spadix]MBP3973185.1 flagellar hook-associated protein FlgL [Pseudoxanthomonas spadix]RMW95227.1 flagellar hook-associated protein 3 [Pseudoxanthomonas spadix]
MTLRLSTMGMHQQSLTAMLAQQSRVARSQLELTTQKKLITAADDPAGMAQAQRLDHAIAALDQQDKDAALLEHRLRSQEQALTDVGTQLDRARQLTIQAGNDTLNAADRTSIAAELRQIREAVLAIANRDDGTGHPLFAGSRDAVIPFTQDASGNVSYVGDDGQNRVEVAPNLKVAGTDAGSTLFLRIRTGDGTSVATAASSNTGSGVIGGSAVTDNSLWNGQSVTVSFTATDAYQILDSAGTVLSTGSYTAGSTISGAGIQMTLSGAPAVGDSFSLGKAPNQDIFSTLDTLADALEAPATTDAQVATRRNALNRALGDISTAQDHFLLSRSQTGSRLAALDDATDVRSAYGVSLQTTLSTLRDVDPAEAASNLSLQQIALEAAQKTMLAVQSKSLFDLM